MDDSDSEYLDELAALGPLDGDDLREFQRLLESGNEELRRHDAEYDETASLTGAAVPPPETRSPEVRKELMRRIQAAYAIQQGIEVPGKMSRGTVPGLSFVHAAEAEWLPHPVEGISFKELSIKKESGYVTLLLRAAPGVHYPAHHHTGVEECYVIEGDLHINDEVLAAGDFHHADAGSDHIVVFTEGGCTLLLVVAATDYAQP